MSEFLTCNSHFGAVLIDVALPSRIRDVLLTVLKNSGSADLRSGEAGWMPGRRAISLQRALNLQETENIVFSCRLLVLSDGNISEVEDDRGGEPHLVCVIEDKVFIDLDLTSGSGPVVPGLPAGIAYLLVGGLEAIARVTLPHGITLVWQPLTMPKPAQ